MQQKILTLFARTPVHVGAGNSVGVVDSPVMRERHTRIPIIPGSSLKGVLRDEFCDKKETQTWLFGSDDANNASAGALLIGEARVLEFHVRSAKGGFAWITCQLALNRFKRDAGLDFDVPKPQADDQCFTSREVVVENQVVLEEYCYSVQGEVPSTLVEAFVTLADDAVWSQIKDHIVIVSDGLFCHFVEQACQVVTRVRIDDETGTVAKGALFNQEQVPSETLFYAVINAQTEKTKLSEGRTAEDALAEIFKAVETASVFQFGGDETIGLGFCSAKII